MPHVTHTTQRLRHHDWRPDICMLPNTVFVYQLVQVPAVCWTSPQVRQEVGREVSQKEHCCFWTKISWSCWSLISVDQTRTHGTNFYPDIQVDALNHSVACIRCKVRRMGNFMCTAPAPFASLDVLQLDRGLIFCILF